MQVQSDYTFTALVGAFGATVAWGAAIGAAVWLHRLVRQHGRVTRGEPRWVLQGARRVPDVQALLSWIGVAWVVLTSCQLAVTIAGNVAVLPLTGVTVTTTTRTVNGKTVVTRVRHAPAGQDD